MDFQGRKRLEIRKKTHGRRDRDPGYAIYHAQQCAEKALKAYLSFKLQPVQRTHDVEFLVELCCEIDASFKQLLDHARILTPYSAAFRYPDIVMVPDKEDVSEAIEKASEVLSFVTRMVG